MASGPHPLHAVDEVLGELAANPTQTSTRRLRRFAHAILGALPEPIIAEEAEVIEALFGPMPKASRRIVAACLLRLLAVAPAYFDDMRFAEKARNLLDTAVPDLYKSLGLRASQQWFEKRADLVAVGPTAESQFYDLLAETKHSRSPAALRVARKNWDRAVARSDHIVKPFLAKDLIGERTAVLFQLTANVLDSPPEQRVAAERAFDDANGAYVEAATRHATRYASEFQAGLARALAEVVSAHAADHPLRRAELEVEPVPKKYPLHAPGQRFRARLELTNACDGPAIDVTLDVRDSDLVDPLHPRLFIGAVLERRQVVELELIVLPQTNGGAESAADARAAVLLLEIGWRNADGSTGLFEGLVELAPQTGDIDWPSAGLRSPYPLVPLTKPGDLVGRSALLEELRAGVTTDHMQSYAITGQKRVGKTSIAQALATDVRSDRDDTATGYLLTGAYASSTSTYISAIADEVRRAVVRRDGALAKTIPPVPRPSEPACILETLHHAWELHPNLRLILILDEFDELPRTLYSLNDEARAFFNVLRTLMMEPLVSLVLVGGERLNFVLAEHSSALNLLNQKRVDTFGKAQLSDYAELVRRPAAGVLEYGDRAVARLHELTAGHPFYTRLLCGRIYQDLVEAHDPSVTEREVDEAVAVAVEEAGQTSFAHYWEDGILEADDSARQAERRDRALVLVALARMLRVDGGGAREQDVERRAEGLALSGPRTRDILARFEQRRVLARTEGELLAPQVPLFGRWLRERGIAELITTVPDPSAALRLEEEREIAKVSAADLVRLVKRWGTYRGRPISEDRARGWLEQFGDERAQRRAFVVLEQLAFVRDLELREWYGQVHTRRLMANRERHPVGQSFRDVILVASDDPGKSGAGCVRLYSQETHTHAQNRTTFERLSRRLKSRREPLNAIAIVDDFIGTGKTMTDQLEELDLDLVRSLVTSGTAFAVVVHSAHERGVRAVQEWLSEKAIAGELYVKHQLSDDDSAFHESSRAFTSAAEREAARALFESLGRRLVPNAPLGFGGMGLTLAFESNIPNNCLPALWAAARDWTPLFPRH